MRKEETKLLICKLTGITDGEYELQKFETAYKYLEAQLPGDAEAVKLLTEGEHFWKWWTSQWERRNLIVLNNFNYTDHLMPVSHLVRKRALISYNAIHEVSALNFILNRVIMKSTFKVVCALDKVGEKQTAHSS